MRDVTCNECGADVSDQHRFCRICGAALPERPDTDPTDTDPTDTAPTDTAGAEFAPPAAGALVTGEPATGELASGELVIIETDPVTADDDITVPILYDLADDEPDLVAVPQQRTEQFPVVAPISLVDPTDPSLARPPRIGVVAILGTLTGIVALVGMFPRVVAVRTDSSAPTFPTGDWLVADVGTNLPGALIVALVSLLVGIVGAVFRQRWGYGLAGGSGLAIAGWSALTIGLVERPVQVALDAVDGPVVQTFSVTITRDIGYGLIVAAGVGGVLTFLASLPRAAPDHRRSLNPWIAAVGALAALVAAAGPLLPEGAASLEDNWTRTGTSADLPVLFVGGRLLQLGLLALAGVVGFLLVRRYGLGLAIGGLTVSAWLAVTTLFDLGESPVGPGVANPGSDLGTPDLHSVTLVGLAALLALATVAVIAAYDQAAREP